MLTHPRSLNWWLKSLLLVTLAAVVPARAEIKQGSAVVFALTGTADYIDDRGLSHPLKAGDVLHPGDTIKTGADSGVDLLLEHVKSTLGLFSDTVLKLDRLSYEDTRTGRITQTRLDLKAGELMGTAAKQLAGSRFEVNTPKTVAYVRGTTFFINSQTGDVHVTEGSVMVKVRLVTETNTLEKTVTVSAGQSLFIPNQFASEAEFNSLSPSPTPPNLSADKLEKLAQKDRNYQKYVRTGTGNVTETFQASRKAGGKIIVFKPPTSIEVSP